MFDRFSCVLKSLTAKETALSVDSGLSIVLYFEPAKRTLTPNALSYRQLTLKCQLTLKSAFDTISCPQHLVLDNKQLSTTVCYRNVKMRKLTQF